MLFRALSDLSSTKVKRSFLGLFSDHGRVLKRSKRGAHTHTHAHKLQAHISSSSFLPASTRKKDGVSLRTAPGHSAPAGQMGKCHICSKGLQISHPMRSSISLAYLNFLHYLCTHMQFYMFAESHTFSQCGF